MNIKTLTLAFTLLLGSLSLVATSTEPSISATGTKSFVIDKDLWKSETVSVVIDDASGSTIYSAVQKLTKSKRFNLQDLENGMYKVTISNNYKSVENEIVISDAGLVINFDANTTYKPVFAVNVDHIDLNFLAAGKNTTVSIDDDNGNIWKSEIKHAKSINKRYDLSKLRSGAYTMTVYANGHAYTTSFQK